MKMPEELQKAVLEIVRICEKRKRCNGCPFWDDDLECRLRNPTSWWVADWKGKRKMKTPELKLCPFCGGMAAPLYKHMTANGYDGTVYRIRCATCHAQSPYKRNAWLHGWHENLADAADAWNRRCFNEIAR